MKIISVVLLFLLLSQTSRAQSLAINTDGSTANNSALLDVKSTTKGILIPRMDSLQRATILTPATGLLVYQTNKDSGFYYFSGTAWQQLITTGNNLWKKNANNIYNNNIGNVGIGVINPLAKLHVVDSTVIFSADGPVNYSSAYLPVFGEGRRMIWYPDKAALRAGYVSASQWDNANIGYHSAAFGIDVIASGESAMAFGSLSNASGSHSIAMGRNALAGGDYSISIGNNATASGGWAIAAGSSTANGLYSVSCGISTADGSFATAMGNQSTAVGDHSTAIGFQSNAGGDYSTAIGISTASEDFATAIGDHANAAGTNSVAIGFNANASGLHAIALGNNTVASGTGAVALGESFSAGFYSTAMGNSTAENFYATAMGSSAALGFGSTAMGYLSNAFGDYATAMGNHASAVGDNATSMGSFTIARATNALVIGTYNDSTVANTLFEIGNGTANNARHNVLTVLENGNVGVGVTDPAYILDAGARMRLRSTPGFTAGTWLNNEVNSASPAFIGMRGDNLVGFYGSGAPNSGWGLLMNTDDGRVGIGTDIPAAALHVIGNIIASGTITPSDLRYKKNIQPIDQPLQKLLSLNGVSYLMNSISYPQMHFDNNTQYGLIAQEVEKVFPEMVKQITADGYMGIDYVKLVPVLIEGLKALNEKIEQQQKQIELLKNEK